MVTHSSTITYSESFASRVAEWEESHRIDPRPDLQEDHHLWKMLLTAVNDVEDANGLYGALHGLRCEGARLIPSLEGVRLDGSMVDNWPTVRAVWLVPHAKKLSALLKELI